jgi:hypothetical protein
LYSLGRKLGWRLGLQAVTGVLSLSFFLGVLYRSASLYHPQRRAILHLKNQRKKVKEKKGRIAVSHKSPFLDFSPLRIRAVQMLLLASSTAALGLYTPVFYLALQSRKEGLEDSALVLMQTFLGFATALGSVGFGLIVVRPSDQCLISRQYLCQASMVGVGKTANQSRVSSVQSVKCRIRYCRAELQAFEGGIGKLMKLSSTSHGCGDITVVLARHCMP